MSLSNTFRFLLALSLCCLVPLEAQVATGTINITVVDSSGAVVPGAAVKLSNNNTGLARGLRAGLLPRGGPVPYGQLAQAIRAVLAE